MKSKKTFRIFVSVFLVLVLVAGSTGNTFGHTGSSAADSVNSGKNLPSITASKSAKAKVSTGSFVKGEIIIVYKKNTSSAKIKASLAAKGCTLQEKESLSNGVKITLAEFSDSDTCARAITRAEADKDVIYAQPNYKYKTYGAESAPDPYANDDGNNQWYLSAVKAREAWVIAEGKGTNVSIGIADSGIDTKHEDLQANLNKPLSKRIGLDGSITAMLGDDHGHGTHVSGIIGGTYNNGIGIAGVASGLGMIDMIVAGIGLDGQISSMEVCNSVMYLTEQNVRVINLSLGGEGRDLLISDLISYVTNSKNILFCCAAGNDSTDSYTSPSDEGEALSVCSITRAMMPSSFTNYGSAKDISAPGSNIISTVPDNSYAHYNGTSMAAPIVTAVAGMCFSVNPELNPYQVKNILEASATDICDPGFDSHTGYGCVNAEAAVKAALEGSASVAATSVDIKDGEKYITLALGDNITPDVLVRPASCLKDVRWSSSDSSVATVGSHGNIKAVGEGIVRVTATCGGKSATFTVTVPASPFPHSITLTGIPESVCAGDFFTAGASVSPETVKDQSIAWYSSDEKVLNIDEYGLAAANKPGKVTITAKAYNGISATKEVTVTPRIESITVSNDKGKKVFNTGESAPTFIAHIAHAESSNADITWKSTNRSVMEIDPKSGAAVINGKGNTTIYASATNGINDRMNITVTGKRMNYGEKTIPFITDNVFDENEEELQDLFYQLESSYDYYINSKGKYSTSMWREIQTAYNTYYEKIKEENYQALDDGTFALRYLGMLTKKYMKNKNLNKIKKLYSAKVKKTYKTKTKNKNYTKYWREALLDARNIGINNIKSASTFTAAAVAMGSSEDHMRGCESQKHYNKSLKSYTKRINNTKKLIENDERYSLFTEEQKLRVNDALAFCKKQINCSNSKYQMGMYWSACRDILLALTGVSWDIR